MEGAARQVRHTLVPTAGLAARGVTAAVVAAARENTGQGGPPVAPLPRA
ncbi:hypothetical protein E2C01_094464 [Portunus trituberculatus]|uniref:Uncharacterized protein n=1 Tax=Portunus trituberculatus TaxID=210409 RepID=A0A5B7JW75_PORTR|nr:hypothetical protein [Portunus trituberculatus]